MRVLALASQKGGSGKTTLSGHLAVQAQRAGAGPVVLIDIDPQGSLADWWNEREAELPAFAQTTVARLANDLNNDNTSSAAAGASVGTGSSPALTRRRAAAKAKVETTEEPDEVDGEPRMNGVATEDHEMGSGKTQDRWRGKKLPSMNDI